MPSHMSRFKNFEFSTLIELLAFYTDQLTQLFSNHTLNAEYEACKRVIEELILEIESRKKIHKDISIINTSVSS